MHIKKTPISENNEFAGFELDTSKIELHSSDKHSICLPYSGPLPDALQKNDGVYILVNLIVGLKISIFLVVTEDKKDRHYSIEATAQEIDSILFPFFFLVNDGTSYPTRWDTGLARYYLGSYQSSFTHWRRFVYEGHGIDGVIDQLSPEAFNRVVRYIEYKKTV